jgi:hypothetical protein
MQVANSTQRFGKGQRTTTTNIEGKNAQSKYQNENISRLHKATKIPGTISIKH